MAKQPFALVILPDTQKRKAKQVGVPASPFLGDRWSWGDHANAEFVTLGAMAFLGDLPSGRRQW
ncbi:hypothetical protein COO20_06800 [Thalassospira marina]|uniref:Uncharacterized protein n=1 Tax=Thalassospira marina TaxID=2048283 RepID=A0A2N3KX31_9PROT|nr:hypothetical protein COO20_06800 [Thalassospira marina]